ncbi:MAG: CDP-diacylglycerol--glycerol-3-phosphate 3-phosphatidyltransferase [Verrucomicrobia bacterium GWF2_51_19]|nr:MAG: CDP-diacylglycerol--glycerol-3-phosphate 3-phosphatidyltransferase [Verrucomicrobia bacterium GWF2_51_19]HCJ11738.1 CDP-diacylglycerol--glycerol-3-phosphate 3-phosphatidyltransferase [Opitutae bacterium]
MNVANLITLSRFPMLFVIVALLYLPWRFTASLAFVFFVMTAMTDWLDGYIARRWKMVSNFGKLMDALLDKILSMGLFISLLSLDVLPKWTTFLVIIILAREFFVTGLRLVAASRGDVLEADKRGKQKTVTQILAIGALLLAFALKNDWANLLSPKIIAFVYDVGVIIFCVATYWTISSGTYYFLKYKYLLRD